MLCFSSRRFLFLVFPLLRLIIIVAESNNLFQAGYKTKTQKLVCPFLAKVSVTEGVGQHITMTSPPPTYTTPPIIIAQNSPVNRENFFFISSSVIARCGAAYKKRAAGTCHIEERRDVHTCCTYIHARAKMLLAPPCARVTPSSAYGARARVPRAPAMGRRE